MLNNEVWKAKSWVKNKVKLQMACVQQDKAVDMLWPDFTIHILSTTFNKRKKIVRVCAITQITLLVLRDRINSMDSCLVLFPLESFFYPVKFSTVHNLYNIHAALCMES